MKLFLDTAAIEEIRITACWGVLDGVMASPTLLAKLGASAAAASAGTAAREASMSEVGIPVTG